MKIRKAFLACTSLIIFCCVHFLRVENVNSQTAFTPNYYQTLAQADQLYLDQDISGAEKLYRSVKQPFPEESSISDGIITDPEELSGAGRVYWREAQRGWDNGLETATMVPLRELIKTAPNFQPGHELMIQALREFGPEEDVLPAIEQAVNQFPESVELTKMQAEALAEQRMYLEASIAYRQFALVYDQHPQAPEFAELADKNFRRFRRNLEQQLIAAGFLTVITGTSTGQGLDQVVALAPFLLQGESGMGAQLAAAELTSRRVITDPEIQEYVNSVGYPMAELMGRNDFTYEFFVIEDDSLNAFALPGGKIFINSGALQAIDTEAEFAGLMGHEIAHSVLSHGYQKVIQGNLLTTLGQTIGLGNVVNYMVLENGRRTERQSDLLGTRAIATAGYAADGLHTFMAKLGDQNLNLPPEYLSSHPLPNNRVRYLETLIQRNGYNRYAFEGVERHAAIKQRLQGLTSG